MPVYYENDDGEQWRFPCSLHDDHGGDVDAHLQAMLDQVCDECLGEGRLGTPPCEACDGTGWSKERYPDVVARLRSAEHRVWRFFWQMAAVCALAEARLNSPELGPIWDGTWPPAVLVRLEVQEDDGGDGHG